MGDGRMLLNCHSRELQDHSWPPRGGVRVLRETVCLNTESSREFIERIYEKYGRPGAHTEPV